MDKELLNRAFVWTLKNTDYIDECLGTCLVSGWHYVIAAQLVNIAKNKTPAGFLETIYKKFLADISAPELTNQEG